MAIVFLGLGSNLGDRVGNMHQAVAMLEAVGLNVLRVSSFLETVPVGGPPQGLFLNAVVKAETQLLPLEVLAVAQSVEAALGRVRTVVNGPRTIDVDILLYDDVEIKTPDLTVPHPRMWERDFVLRPLREIAPELF